MEVLREYKTHHYIEESERDNDQFCPTCGVQGQLWRASAGDYYLGSETICTACGNSNYLDNGGNVGDPKIIEQLKSGITHKPTTPPGN